MRAKQLGACSYCGVCEGLAAVQSHFCLSTLSWVLGSIQASRVVGQVSDPSSHLTGTSAKVCAWTDTTCCDYPSVLALLPSDPKKI